MRYVRSRILPFAAGLGLALLGAGRAEAELIIGLTTTNSLITFDSATPEINTPAVAITGLVAGDQIIGIDRRPANGLIYGVGVGTTAGTRLYTLNPGNGAATLVSTLDPATTLGSTVIGMDFNPVPDRLRLITTTQQNLRINVDTGATISDLLINPTVRRIVGSAYTNNVPGATSTTLYNLDSVSDSLFIQNPPNDGTQVLVGSLGVPFSDLVGFDISGSTGIAYASLTNENNSLTRFFSINLATGAATRIGDINETFLLRDITVAVPEPSSVVLVGIGLGLTGLIATRRQRRA